MASLFDLLSEGATLCKACFAAAWLAQHCGATSAEDDCLRVAEHGRYAEAARALHVHEEGVWTLDKSLELMTPLLKFPRRVEQINISHRNVHHGREVGWARGLRVNG
eukprot:CAMPEP_0119315520 /NCGR_PEP_ID=MMETSP1333-20130426/36193_1 /TAXON_ID=418940 /ORGANISM="Scyphosphaera apsteinii, Strain RCC1455" /LENGTH=106 /DNA_ID=CAMNT_0007320911 /DNA_START=352 /DNA_END=669 /DNA_ORIENTATION=+